MKRMVENTTKRWTRTRNRKRRRKKRRIRRKIKVKEYVSERAVRGNGLKWARRECMDREGWKSFCRGHPLVGRFWRERGVGAID